MDLLERYGELDFPLEFYTEVRDPAELAAAVASHGPRAFSAKHCKLTAALCEVVADYALVQARFSAIIMPPTIPLNLIETCATDV